MTKDSKETLIKELVDSLRSENEIVKIVVFGSFIHADDPNDLDVAIFQTSNESYLSLAMKYRGLIRKLTKKIAIDIIPIRPAPGDSMFLSEIENGEVVYER